MGSVRTSAHKSTNIVVTRGDVPAELSAELVRNALSDSFRVSSADSSARQLYAVDSCNLGRLIDMA